MNVPKRKFVYSKAFDRQCEELHLTDSDLDDVIDTLSDNPKAGDVMSGTGGLRKIRISSDNRGKSHCARVCYLDVEIKETILFVLIFAKKDMDNLTQKECNILRKKTSELKKSIR